MSNPVKQLTVWLPSGKFIVGTLLILGVITVAFNYNYSKLKNGTVAKVLSWFGYGSGAVAA
jgi:hypothetical protein